MPVQLIIRLPMRFKEGTSHGKNLGSLLKEAGNQMGRDYWANIYDQLPEVFELMQMNKTKRFG